MLPPKLRVPGMTEHRAHKPGIYGTANQRLSRAMLPDGPARWNAADDGTGRPAPGLADLVAQEARVTW